MIILIILIIVLLLSLFLINKTLKKKDNILDDVKLQENIIKNDGFALMLQQDDGTYKEKLNNSWPTDMIFNNKLSGCIDTDGNKIGDALSFDKENNVVNISIGETAYCYVYFDINNIYNQIVRDADNNNGAELLSANNSTNDKEYMSYDVYHYIGDVTNNNVLFGNFCWQMVTTTESKGVKIIYNGLPKTEDDGTISCNNTGDASQIGTSSFNDNYTSPAHVGYMYNKVYEYDIKNLDFLNSEYEYGNTFIYSNGTYTLSNTKSFSDWNSNYNTLNNHHYTCFNKTGTCTDLYYIYYTNDSYAYYITLTNGKNIGDALNEMLYDNNVNTKDSTIKTYIDNWYENNLKDTMDSEGNKYSNYLENTIFCNNREVINENSNGWNPNGGSTSVDMIFNRDAIECKNKLDQFTLNAELDSRGDKEYGNNALKYPIGLLSYRDTIYPVGYLNTEKDYWLFSPVGFGDGAVNSNILSSKIQSGAYIFNSLGVRPVVSLSSDVSINSGDGSYTNPYQVKLK